MKGLSLFSSAGIGETYLTDIGIDIIAANELLPKRAELYRAIYPKCRMICGDITHSEVFDAIMNAAKGVEFMIASPPCQGMSIAGKNRHQDMMIQDDRNFLINYVFKAIKHLSPSYIIIENVPTLFKIKLPYNDRICTVVEILQSMFGNEYSIEGRVVDSASFGVPQTRLRAIIKMFPKNQSWPWPPHESKKVAVRETIGYLPSLEAGEHSGIKWHYARNHTKENIKWMKHTPTGCSAFANKKHFPQKKDGTRIKGYESSYRRIRWDEPAPTITMRNDCIGSQRNVHPGRKKTNGTYSDARVLTPLELMLLNSLPYNWKIPENTPEILIRQVIGESIPPLMIKKIIVELPCLKK